MESYHICIIQIQLCISGQKHFLLKYARNFARPLFSSLQGLGQSQQRLQSCWLVPAWILSGGCVEPCLDVLWSTCSLRGERNFREPCLVWEKLKYLVLDRVRRSGTAAGKGYLVVESSEWAGTYECGVCGQAGWPSIGQGTKQTSWGTLSLRLCDVMGRWSWCWVLETYHLVVHSMQYLFDFLSLLLISDQFSIL